MLWGRKRIIELKCYGGGGRKKIDFVGGRHHHQQQVALLLSSKLHNMVTNRLWTNRDNSYRSGVKYKEADGINILMFGFLYKGHELNVLLPSFKQQVNP